MIGILRCCLAAAAFSLAVFPALRAGAQYDGDAATPADTPTPALTRPAPRDRIFRSVDVRENGRWVKTARIPIGDSARFQVRFRRTGAVFAGWKRPSAVVRIYRYCDAIVSTTPVPGSLYTVPAKRRSGRHGYTIFTFAHRFVARKFLGRMLAAFYITNGVGVVVPFITFRVVLAGGRGELGRCRRTH